jgi:hypothetical protein
VQRVRPRPALPSQYLSFGQNTIGWLRSMDAKWSATPVVAYYTPFALYRRSDRDDYMEIARLGSRCQLRVVNVSELNTRSAAREDAAFDCGTGQATAYANHLLFAGEKGVRFDDDGTVEVLSASEVADLNKKVSERQICLFSEEPTNEVIDFAKLPPADTLKCYTRTEYQALLMKR